MRSRGRPKSIDVDAALEAAMRLFWERGFESVGMDELARCMGLSVATVYATFQSKQELFLAAMDRYEEQKRVYAEAVLNREQPAKAAFQELLEVSALQLTKPDQPRGCMLNLALHNCSEAAEPLRALIQTRRSSTSVALEKRLQVARKAGELDSKCDIKGLVRFFVNTIQGMSLQAREGASRADLLLVARWAMRAWPEEA